MKKVGRLGNGASVPQAFENHAFAYAIGSLEVRPFDEPVRWPMDAHQEARAAAPCVWRLNADCSKACSQSANKRLCCSPHTGRRHPTGSGEFGNAAVLCTAIGLKPKPERAL